MANTALDKPAAKGGGFLVESPSPQDVFTPADLSDDHKLIGQTTEEFVLNEVLPVVRDLEAKKPGLMAGLCRKAGELGLMGPGIAEEYGGAGLDDVAITVLTEKVSVDASFAITQSCHAGLGTVPIVDFGSEEQKRKYLPKLASGEYIGAFALSEPQSGSDAGTPSLAPSSTRRGRTTSSTAKRCGSRTGASRTCSSSSPRLTGTS